MSATRPRGPRGWRRRRRPGSPACRGAADGRTSHRISESSSITPVVSWSPAKASNSAQVLELERQPGRRQLLEHQRPVGGVAGVDAGPDRRGRRERLQVRVVVEQRGEHRHHPVALGQADVHVHAPDQHLPAPPLGAVDQLLVAVAGGELLLGPRRRTGGCRRRTGRRPSSSAGRHHARAGCRAGRPPPRRRCGRRRSRPRRCCAAAPGAAARGRAAGGRPRRTGRRPCCARSRVRRSTSASSHSTPSVGSAKRGSRCAPGQRSTRGRLRRYGHARGSCVEPDVATSASGSGSCCSPPARAPPT